MSPALPLLELSSQPVALKSVWDSRDTASLPACGHSRTVCTSASSARSDDRVICQEIPFEAMEAQNLGAQWAWAVFSGSKPSRHWSPGRERLPPGPQRRQAADNDEFPSSTFLEKYMLRCRIPHRHSALLFTALYHVYDYGYDYESACYYGCYDYHYDKFYFGFHLVCLCLVTTVMNIAMTMLQLIRIYYDDCLVHSIVTLLVVMVDHSSLYLLQLCRCCAHVVIQSPKSFRVYGDRADFAQLEVLTWPPPGPRNSESEGRREKGHLAFAPNSGAINSILHPKPWRLLSRCPRSVRRSFVS